MDTRAKIRCLDELPAGPLALAYGRIVALTAGHCRALARLKASTGGPVVVAVAADADGGVLPLDEASRAQLAAAVGAVDFVVVCDAARLAGLRAGLPAERLLDLEAEAGRDVVADVLERHPPE